ncbi:recombinase family protein, partial [Cryobacterium sp. TMT4-31]|uniref:recombinase family protein n=1 Tax=Cryobacterium sp. TMT4-31 TaxID=1259259 RepID=UPI001F5461B3
MTKLIGYARVSTRQQSTDRQEVDLLADGVRRDDLYVDNGDSGARASRPNIDRALDALEAGDTLVITTLDRLGRSTQNMLAFAEELRGCGAGLRVLNLGGGDVDTATPMGSMLFTIMAALVGLGKEFRVSGNAGGAGLPQLFVSNNELLALGYRARRVQTAVPGLGQIYGGGPMFLSSGELVVGLIEGAVAEHGIEDVAASA